FISRINCVDTLSSTGSDLSWLVEAWGVTLYTEEGEGDWQRTMTGRNKRKLATVTGGGSRLLTGESSRLDWRSGSWRDL
ncbi:hypothetical protein PIB30_030612, partial [Stylosanthes scabra]|nr:hypothetical protein [Stylosanthes scabra]